MGFISYSQSFLRNKLNLYESVYKNNAPKPVVHEAKVLLKFLEDIRDEGYENSYFRINKSCTAVNRLKMFIAANNEKPFFMHKHAGKSSIKYETCEYHLEVYLSLLDQKINVPHFTFDAVPDIFYDILSYSKSVFKNSNSETAYGFLLRDALLPYLAFKKWDSTSQHLNIVPLFISRKFFSFFEKNNEELYSFVQNIIFDALDNNAKTFEQLKSYVKASLVKSSADLTRLVDAIKAMLNIIPQKHIMVIESGYIGTMPVLLSAIDDRVDFRMFTTIPYFYEVYKNKFFTKNFEKLRLFETIQCQDALFKLSSVLNNGQVKVRETSDFEVKNNSIRELLIWSSLINQSQDLQE